MLRAIARFVRMKNVVQSHSISSLENKIIQSSGYSSHHQISTHSFFVPWHKAMGYVVQFFLRFSIHSNSNIEGFFRRFVSQLSEPFLHDLTYKQRPQTHGLKRMLFGV